MFIGAKGLAVGYGREIPFLSLSLDYSKMILLKMVKIFILVLNEEIICILAFGDDNIIISESVEELQKMLDCVESWDSK